MKLKKILKEKGIKQIELAKKMGLSRQAVNYWANNVVCPSLKNIKKICEILEISADELIGLKNNEHKKISKNT